MDPDKHLNEIERFPVVEEEARRFCSNRPSAYPVDSPSYNMW